MKFLTDIKGQSTIENEKRISINKNLYIILKKIYKKVYLSRKILNQNKRLVN